MTLFRFMIQVMMQRTLITHGWKAYTCLEGHELMPYQTEATQMKKTFQRVNWGLRLHLKNGKGLQNTEMTLQRLCGSSISRF